MQLPSPYVLFLGDVDPLSAKTASGIAYWRPERCVGQIALPGATADLGLPALTPARARAQGARLLIVGVANFGGGVSEAWLPTLESALAAGLDLAAGLHQRLADLPTLAALAAQHGRTLYDVRQPPADFRPIASGAKRSGRRLLTVGTDCAVGKMFTSLALEKALRARSIPADFRATGQTGVFIAGAGTSVDAVVSDFVAGAAELLSPPADPAHWDLVEGQGSLHHPAYAGVTLGLIHGSQPDALVICHGWNRAHIDGYPSYPTPSMAEAIEANTRAARLTNPAARVVGISVNTREADEASARAYLDALAREWRLPACDPLRTGVEPIVARLLEEFPP
jgi:uncharacterized NAD-dependent epimerase/dehydratase family protein